MLGGFELIRNVEGIFVGNDVFGRGWEWVGVVLWFNIYEVIVCLGGKWVGFFIEVFRIVSRREIRELGSREEVIESRVFMFFWFIVVDLFCEEEGSCFGGMVDELEEWVMFLLF